MRKGIPSRFPRLGRRREVREGIPRTNLDDDPSTWEQPTPGQENMRGQSSQGAADTGQDRYQVMLRDLRHFGNLRVEDVDERSAIQRVVGQRDGGWEAVKLLINKEHCHVEHGRLIGDTEEVRSVLSELGSRPVHTGGNRFMAQPGQLGPTRPKQRFTPDVAEEAQSVQEETMRGKRGTADLTGHTER